MSFTNSLLQCIDLMFISKIISDLKPCCVLQIGDMDKDDMGRCLKKYDMKSPITGNEITEPINFNLMFATSIGPTGQLQG